MTIEKLKAFRKELHRYPELSGQEVGTAERIKNFIAEHHEAEIIENLGGNGLALVYTFSDSGPTVVIRCELDALPIYEVNDFEHRSLIEGISHKCGHDGHMAIVAGLTFWLNAQDFKKGKVVLLFQPAEETGAGAHGVLNDQRFRALHPDYMFALHNIPGQPLHSIIVREGNFSATVQSVAIELQGTESHSAEPEHGVNPALCLAELTQKIDQLNRNDATKADFRLCVPIYSSMGVKSYGISAGSGEIHYTLRTKDSGYMEALKHELEGILAEVCPKHQLPYEVRWFEYFPAVVNDGFCNQVIREAAEACSYDSIEKGTAFKFGEDFGWFSEKYQAAMFGLGAGLGSPALHQADYDFPDELIETGMAMFKGIITKVLTH